MSVENASLHLPHYDDFVTAIEALSLPMSASALHGMMCGYLCAGADSQGEAYLRALLHQKKDAASRNALLAMSAIYFVSQQQISTFDFAFELLLPAEDSPLLERAQEFGAWCDGFVQGLSVSGVGLEQFYDEEAQDALQHIMEFSELDIDELGMEEEDEKAFTEVTEYTRMAVIRLHGDLIMNERERSGSDTTH